MQSLKVFLSERLTAAAEEIFGAVEKTIAEYKEEISRSKDLEISRLRMQLKLLKSGGFECSMSATKPHTVQVMIKCMTCGVIVPRASAG